MRGVVLGLALAFALPLAGCATLQPQVAQAVTVTKQTRIAANRLYVAAVDSLKVLEAQGLVTAARRRALADDLYKHLLQVRAGQMEFQAFALIVSSTMGGAN